MDKNKPQDPLRTFFCFGMTVYAVCFFAMVHFYRVSKAIFRDGFGDNYIWPTSGLDFSHLYNVSTVVRDGKIGLDCYPPWTGVFLIPFTFFGFHSAYVLFTFFSLALLFLTIFLCLRENKTFVSVPMDMFVALLCAGLFYHSYPVFFTLERGQIDIVMVFCMMAGLLALSRGFRKTAALVLAIATQFKVYPLILGGVLFIRYGWKALAGFMAFNVLILFMRGPVVGLGSIELFRSKIGIRDPWPGNHCLQSFAHEMVRLGHLPAGWELTAWRVSIAAVVLIFALAFLWVVLKGKPRTPSVFSVAEAGPIGMAFQVMCLVPISSHDYRLPILIVPFLLMISRDKTDFTLPKGLQYVLIAGLSASMAFIFVPFFLIKTFGIIASFIIYAIFTVFSIPRRAGAA